MSNTVIEVLSHTEIRVRCSGVFGDESPRSRFLTRIFGAPAIRSVEIDVLNNSALIRCYQTTSSVATLLEDLATKLLSGSDDLVSSNRYYKLPRKTGPLAFVRAPKEIHGIRRGLYQATGCFFAGMSVVGVISPFVPTSPFVLLSSYFLFRSSETLHERMMNARIFGPIIDDFYVHGGVRQRIKRNTLLFITAAWGVSVALVGFAPSMIIAMGMASLFSVSLMIGLPTIREQRTFIEDFAREAEVVTL